jgi:hypothetical protein
MIVWLTSYPRSGNTFFRILLKELYGIQTYSIYDDGLFVKLRATKLVGQRQLPRAGVDSLRAGPRPNIVKTHDMPTVERYSVVPRIDVVPHAQEGDPVIFLLRDARDALVSQAHFVLSYRNHRGAKPPFRSVLKQQILKPRWTQMTRVWYQHDWTGPHHLVRFEDLVKDPVNQVKAAVEVTCPSLKPVRDKPPTFEELHAQRPGFFRRGKVGAYLDEMPEDLQRLFWTKHREGMELAGYG